MKRFVISCFITLFCVALFSGVVGAQDASTKGAPAKETVKIGSTLDNLMSAYTGESNAHARYLAFAKKADAQGYMKVGQLFRATAHAEQVHRAREAAVIGAMGKKPHAKMEPIVVKTTRRNLLVPLKGEAKESEEIYPAFIATANKDGNTSAALSFRYAQTAETGHYKMFKEASDSLDSWKKAGKGFYVCGICGLTLVELPATKCPSCGFPSTNFKLIK